MPDASRTAPLPPPKRRQILAGAREVFIELGFDRASVDAIAARAGVSKATVYNHFEDKQALFVACVLAEAEELHEGLVGCLAEPTGPVERSLQRLGERVMRLFLSPAVVALHRHAIAEAGRFPEIGRAIFERGATTTYERVASHLRRWSDAGALRIDDPRAAAVHFIALCQGDLLVRARLGILDYPVDAITRDTVRRGVEAFLRAYRR